MDTVELLRALTAPDGNSGDEKRAADTAEKILEKYGKVRRDRLGSVICEVKTPKNGGRHLLLDAHIDQIALIVTHIDGRGFLAVEPCGGIDLRGILGSSVRVLARDGALTGVVCTIPPHLQGDGEKENPKREDIRVDIGLDEARAKSLVRLGDRVMMTGRFSEMAGGWVTGPALDDRSGCAAIVEALELLSGKDIPCGLTAVFSSREEVGGQGAMAAAFGIEPTEAIEIDVSFGASPDTAEGKAGDMKKGPMVGFSPVLDMAISANLCDLADRHGIPYQCEVMGRSTGTNADDILRTRAGVRCGMTSIPQQYMHTVIEKVAVCDVQNTGRLLAAYVMEGGDEQ